MTAAPSKPPPPAPSIRRLTDLWTVLGKDRRLYAAAIGVQGLVAALQYVVPLVPQSVMDVVFAESTKEAPRISREVTDILGGSEFVRTHLWVAGAVIAAAAALAAVLSVVRGRMTARASQRSARRLRERVHSHLIRLPVAYFDKAESGDLLQRCTSDVETVQNLLSNQITEMGRSVLLVLLAVPLMLAIDGGMALVSLVLVVPIVLFAVLYFRVVTKRFRVKDEAEGRLTARAQENITGIRVVRAFGRQRFERDEFRKRNQEHRDADVALFDAFARFWSLSDVTCLMQLLLVLIVGLWRVAHGTLGAGEYFFFLFATNMYIWPIRMLGRMLADMGKAVVALERLHEVLDTRAEDARETEPLPTERLPDGALQFHDVSFAYGSGATVLNGVSFTVGAHETVALMGPSGSGKSTITSLLQRFYEPTSGQITKGGTPLSTLDRRLVRARTASVLQPPFIYSRSVRDNVRLARADLSHEGVVSAAEDAAIHASVERFQQGYDTVIGERGITLSGGQRQRLAIARALVRDADLMILDDALSAVDAETEREILDAMRERRGRLPTLVIAHRLSTLAEADRIVVLEHGRVSDQGTHAELVARPGLYRRLWEIQAELEAEEPAA